MGIIATGLQTRQKDCYANSARAQLTVRTNAEEKNSVFGPASGIVVAGFDAPTVAPSGSVGGGGTLSGYYVYAYVYASTKYPFVDNVTTVASGETWPRSNPSPMSSVQDASAGSKTVTLTLTKTTRTDVDKILIYRTQTSATSAGASALAAAGELFYIGQTTNNGIAGTVAFSDTGITDTGEELELDNYLAPTCEYCVFDGTYFWVAGECGFEAEVTLAGTSTVTVTSDYALFTGRNGQFVTFDGVTSGGYDGVGTFYAKITAADTVVLYSDADLTTPLAVAFSGTTTMHIRGLSNILYRSKPNNPFSWGTIETRVVNGVTTDTPQTWFLDLGGGNVTAMAVSPNGKRLVIHFDQPQRTTAYDLEFADSAQFGLTQQILDNTNSVTAHFTLFNGQWGNNPVLLGLDTYNGQIVICDGYEQHTIGEDLGHFLEDLPRDDRAHKYFAGTYDSHTDLNYFSVRYYATPERNNIGVWVSATTQGCGWTPDFDLLSMCVFLDDETGERMILGGTELGLFGRILCPDKWFNWGFRFGWDNMIVGTEASGLFKIGWNDQYGSPVTITETSPSTGVFRVDALTVANGQQIVLVSTGADDMQEGVVTGIEQISDSLWEITLAAPYVSVSPNELNVSQHPLYYGREWMVATDSSTSPSTTSLTELYFVKGTFAGFDDQPRPVFDTDYFMQVGDVELDDSGNTIPEENKTVYCYLGGIPTTLRSYYNLSTPTLNKKADEVWITADQCADNAYATSSYTLPAARYYIQYEDDWLEGFPLTQLDSVASVTSIVFTNNTQVPSYEPKSFGVEFIECSQNDWQMYDFTIKVSQTSP